MQPREKIDTQKVAHFAAGGSRAILSDNCHQSSCIWCLNTRMTLHSATGLTILWPFALNFLSVDVKTTRPQLTSDVGNFLC